MNDAPLSSDQGATNTDREIWRERSGDYYADSIHVTKEGFIGINCGGYVYVKPLREWHRLAGGKEAMQPVPDRPVQAEVCPVCHTVHDKPLCPVHMGLDGETPHQGLRNDCDMCAPEAAAERPTAWRKWVDSAYEPRPRWTFTDRDPAAPEGWEPLYTRPAVKTKGALAPATACTECRGSGEICVGNSGTEVDGNAPILERCEACDGTGVDVDGERP